MYVDDAYVIGGLELCGRLKTKLRELWDLKIEGIMQNEHLDLQVGGRVNLEGEEIPIKAEVTYLGMQIGRNEKGIYLHQGAWNRSEILKRSWLHVSGVESLPEIDEGKWEPLEKTTEYHEDLKACQSEIGSLQWICLRSDGTPGKSDEGESCKGARPGEKGLEVRQGDP